MLLLPLSGARRRAVSLLTPLALLLASAIFAPDVAAGTLDYFVGSREVIYTKKQRTNKNLKMWPDGNIGVVRNGNGTYDFYAANGGSPVRTSGSLTNPSASKKASVKINGVPPKTFNYVSGGPVFQDPDSGARLLLYHAEKHGKTAKDYYTVLGLAVSTDSSGLNFQDLGTIIEPNISLSQKSTSLDIGGGSFALFDNHLHVYYRDFMTDGTSAQLAVARAPINEVLSNALARRGTTFNKYYNGSWAETGRGGLASALEVGNPPNGWSSVSYNDYLNGLVMVTAEPTGTMNDLYLSTSADGIHWSPRQALALDSGEQFYPTIIGTGADPIRSGKSFYVYYTDSQKGGWNRWKDAALVRREITLDPLGMKPSVIPPVIAPPGPAQGPPVEDPPLPTEWVSVADYRDDFQIGTPTAGWQYKWNPTGKLGNQSAFVDLKWSNIAQAYNTTGAATPAPAKKKSHNDDYLNLNAAGGGHPGKPDYMPIVGYTIQEDDGDGLYRLAESLIAKSDGTTSKGEDGLELMVYVNNLLIGAPQVVSTNGASLSFDRALGNLNVGDTVWVMVDALKNQSYDGFKNFDFSIQRAVPLEMMSMMAMGGGSFAAMAVPEPGTAAMVLIAVACMGSRRSRRQAN